MTPEKTCERKSRFGTEKKAERSAQKHADQDGRSRTIYRCPFCSFFHISSKLLVGFEGQYAAATSIVMPKLGRTHSLNIIERKMLK